MIATIFCIKIEEIIKWNPPLKVMLSTSRGPHTHLNFERPIPLNDFWLHSRNNCFPGEVGFCVVRSAVFAYEHDSFVFVLVSCFLYRVVYRSTVGYEFVHMHVTPRADKHNGSKGMMRILHGNNISQPRSCAKKRPRSNCFMSARRAISSPTCVISEDKATPNSFAMRQARGKYLSK